MIVVLGLLTSIVVGAPIAAGACKIYRTIAAMCTSSIY